MEYSHVWLPSEFTTGHCYFQMKRLLHEFPNSDLSSRSSCLKTLNDYISKFRVRAVLAKEITSFFEQVPDSIIEETWKQIVIFSVINS